LLNDGKLAEAVEQFTQALKQNPAYALAYNGRGFARYRLKQYAEAIADFDEAIRLNPSYANA
jgi:tetratricopeptide (TPR) repeat protein